MKRFSSFGLLRFDNLKIIFLSLLIIAALVFGVLAIDHYSHKGDVNDDPKYDPAPPEAPKLTEISIKGYDVDFDPEVRYYEVQIPAGNPVLPVVKAKAQEGVDVKVYDGLIPLENNEGSAKIYLDDGKYKNSYEIRFIKNDELGYVLQYGDSLQFTPNYKLKRNEKFEFTSDDTSVVSVDEQGNLKVISTSNESVSIYAKVNGRTKDVMQINSVEKAELCVFILAGQGNAAGIGGDAYESVEPKKGTAYTSEPDTSPYSMEPLGKRAGYSSVLANYWYDNTGEKVLIIHTAISGASIKDWVQGGTAYDQASERIEIIINDLNKKESKFSITKTFYIWQQGEYDFLNDISSEMYIECFYDMYRGMKEYGIDMTAIIPVRYSLADHNTPHIIQPVCAAQHFLGNMEKDIRIISMFPEEATVENGYIAEDNLYYTQSGYNKLGMDVVNNIFKCFDPETEKSVRNIEVYLRDHGTKISYGSVLRLNQYNNVQLVVSVQPLYAAETKLDVVFDEKYVEFSKSGILSIANTNKDDTLSEITFSCGGRDFLINVGLYELGSSSITDMETFTWDFYDLKEFFGKNDLTVSKRSTDPKYKFINGAIIVEDRSVDFKLDKAIVLDYKKNWSIEWNGSLYENSILAGKEYGTKGYIYLAPYDEGLGHSVRIVDDIGKVFYLPYGELAEKNSRMNTWRISYNTKNNTITLYSNGLEVSKLEEVGEFSFTITNLFGRYGNNDVNYNFSGRLDYLSITK